MAKLTDYPNLISEWDYFKNIPDPNNLTHGSTYIAWWNCNDCHHAFQASIAQRTIDGKKCKYCKSLEYLYPKLLKDWDYEKNKLLGYFPEILASMSHVKAWWICKDCQHNWRAVIKNRTNGANCPACSGYMPSEKNRLDIIYPNLISLWSPKNPPIETFSHGSEKIVLWICENNHEYPCSIAYQTENKEPCPYCNNRLIDDLNSFKILYPKLAEYWNDESDINNVHVRSRISINIKCVECSHCWKTTPFQIITKYNLGEEFCPNCVNKSIKDRWAAERLDMLIKQEERVRQSCLATKHPNLMDEFIDPIISPNIVGHRSMMRALWRCRDCGHQWDAVISYRTSYHQASGCPECYKNLTTKSTLETEWLDYNNIPESNRQIRVIKNRKFIVDGFDPKTNTIYEFNGDYWHGNPKIYDLKEKNTKVNKTFGQLYRKTLNKEKLFKRAGFNVISIWESDWVEFKTLWKEDWETFQNNKLNSLKQNVH